MAIKRRSAIKSEAGSKARHRLLGVGRLTLMIYNYVKANPGVTFKQIKALTASGQPITDLVNEGLLRTEGDSKQSYQYYAVPEHAIGPGRDILEVDLQVFVNAYGEYSITHKLYGQQPLAADDFPQYVLTKKIKISIPSPKEKYRQRDIPEVIDIHIVPSEEDTTSPEQPKPLIIEH